MALTHQTRVQFPVGEYVFFLTFVIFCPLGFFVFFHSLGIIFWEQRVPENAVRRLHTQEVGGDVKLKFKLQFDISGDPTSCHLLKIE